MRIGVSKICSTSRAAANVTANVTAYVDGVAAELGR